MFIRAIFCVLLALSLAVNAEAANLPLTLSLPLPDVPQAATLGVESLLLNPAALYINRALALNYYRSFGEDDFDGDDAILVSGYGFGFGYQRLKLDLPDEVSRYDFAVSSRVVENLYSGLSYTYYRSDWAPINKAHAWNASLLYHANRQVALALQARNFNKQKFDGRESSIAYLLGVALRPFGETLTLGADMTLHGSQRLDEATWRLSTRFKWRPGLSLYGGIDDEGFFGAGLEFTFGSVLVGGESFFDDEADYRRSTVYAGISGAQREQVIKHTHAVLQIDVSGEMPEEVVKPFLFGRGPATMYQRLEKIRQAAADPQVRGLLVTIRSPRIGWGRIADLRAALHDFRKTGKPVIAYLGAGVGNGGYYLASAADKVYMLPVDALNLTGLRAEVTFYTGLMEKLGVGAEVEKSGNYKNAPDVFTDTTLSPYYRETLETLLDDLYEQMLADIAQERGITTEHLRAIIDQGPFTSTQAESLRLVDGRFYPHELENKIAELYGDHYGVTPAGRYRNRPQFRERFGEPPQIALIAVEGGIVKGSSGYDYVEGNTVGAATVGGAIRAARTNPAIAAIVMRMNTPGGDAIASDLIWGELAEARQAKPVIISMSDVCASGGYYIASASDQIITEPQTVTGSIGVFAGKPTLSGLYDKLGLRTETIKRGEHANFYSMTEPYSVEERSILRRQVNDMYVRFLDVVADGRGLPADSVHAVAQGRAWSGRRAVELGLADTVGSLTDAINLARERAGIRDDYYEVVEWPQRRLAMRLSSLAYGVMNALTGSHQETLSALLRPLTVTDARVQMRLPYDLTIQ